MNDEAKKLVEALLEDAEWAEANEWETPITLGDHLREAANMVEHLAEENAGLDMLLTSAQSAAETWQRRAEAAERDLKEDEICYHCVHWPSLKLQTAKCDVSEKVRGEFGGFRCKNDCFEWRGPCAKNGGADHAE